MKFSHVLLPTVFLLGTVVASVLMEAAIGKNLDNTIKQLVFLPPGPSHSKEAVVWFWLAVTCFLSFLICSWRAFRYFKKLRRA